MYFMGVHIYQAYCIMLWLLPLDITIFRRVYNILWTFKNEKNSVMGIKREILCV